MKRMLSHIILFTILVICPYSFTTAEIPSIYISVTINAPLQESRKNNITVAHRVAKSSPLTVIARPPDKSFNSFQAIPVVDSHREIEHGRAPPVVPSV